MDPVIKEITKEAYRLWGIGNKEVVYDLPKSTIRLENKKFSFKLNYDKEYDSWPRMYKLSVPVMKDQKVISTKTQSRMILPIILHKDYSSFEFETEAWYDMPQYIHQELMNLVEIPIYKKENTFTRIWNFLKRKKELIKVEQYVFEVTQESEMLVVRIKQQPW